MKIVTTSILFSQASSALSVFILLLAISMVQYMFYDTLKADTANIGNSDEVKKTATILSNLAQKFRIFIASSMQLLVEHLAE